MTEAGQEDLAAALLELERKLMDPEFRRDGEAVSALLAEDFREFGSSGRVWTKETMLTFLAEEAYAAAPAVEEFAVREIAPGTALATYRAVRRDAVSGAAQASLRSSIWVLCEGRWRMLFHQGTGVPGTHAAGVGLNRDGAPRRSS